tara:strand:- start:741 stop:992 length:252 start_codon:yes stop_codon:yes gene_type:complete
MAATKEIICACGCGRKKQVRLSDIKRGWGKFYSKSCKAKYQERRTGQYKNYLCNKVNGSSFFTGRGGEFHQAHLYSNEDCHDF